MTEERPRDRAVSPRSKETLVETRGEGAKEFAFADGPFGRTTQDVMPKIAERFAEVLRSIGECFYDVERLRKCEDARQPQQELLSNSMTGS